jgi:hypothetical protein
MHKYIAILWLVAAGAPPMAASTVYMLLGNGQSLSNGDYGCGAISNPAGQVWANQTYNGSALVALGETSPCLFNTSGTKGVPPTWSSSATFQPYSVVLSSGTLYETLTQSTNQPVTGVPWVAVTTQESPLSSTMNNASVLAPGFSGIANNFGQSGSPISTWGGSSAISNIASKVSAVKSLIGSGDQLVVVGVIVTAGESDFAAGSTGYYAANVGFQSSLQSAIQAVTDQTTPVPVIFSQMSSTEAASPFGYTCPDGTVQNCLDTLPVASTSGGTSAAHVVIAQYQLARDYPNLFYLAGPKYQYSYAVTGGGTGNQGSGYHMNAQGYNMLGAAYARTLACLYGAGFGPNSCAAGVMPKPGVPITLSGNTITLQVQTPGGLPLDQPVNASTTTGNWSNGVIPVPYYGASSNCAPASAPCQHTGNYGFQFFQQVSGSAAEIPVTNVGVNGTTITLTLASAPAGTNWQLAYGFEGLYYAYTPVYGCAWNATSCDNASIVGSVYASGTPHGNIRTVEDTAFPSGQSINGDGVYHWMVHFVENVAPAPGPAVISGGACSGCTF